MSGMRAQQVDDRGQRGIGPRCSIGARRRFCGFGLEVRQAAGFAAVFDEGRRDLGDRKHEICRAGHDGAARHAVVGGILRVLHDNQPASVVHRRQPGAAVAAAAREDRADGSRAAVFGERAQEEIEGQAGAVPLARVR